MKKATLILISSLFILSACNKKPADLIVGKWICKGVEIDLSELKKDYDTISNDVEKAEAMESINILESMAEGIKGSEYSFTKEGNFTTKAAGEGGESFTGKYILTENGKGIVITNEQMKTNDTTDIETLNEKNLVLKMEAEKIKMKLTYDIVSEKK